MKKELFKKYVTENYNMNNELIKGKYDHSLRVVKEMEDLTTSLGFTKENKMLALSKTAALLHDIGRFKQITEYNTFDDRISFDRAKEAVTILKKDNYISNYVKNKKDQKIILKAIYNHNKTYIEENLNQEETILAQLLRDADKLDIFKFLTEKEYERVDGNLNKDIYSRIINLKIDYEVAQNELDKYAINLGLFLDLNYTYSKAKVLKEDYLNIIVNKIIEKNPKHKKEFMKMKNKIQKFLEKETKTWK